MDFFSDIFVRWVKGWERHHQFSPQHFFEGKQNLCFSLNQEGIAFSLMFSLQSFCVCVRHARERYIYLPEFLLLDGKLVGTYTNPMAIREQILPIKKFKHFPHLSSTPNRSWRDEEKRRCVLGIPEMKAM